MKSFLSPFSSEGAGDGKRTRADRMTARTYWGYFFGNSAKYAVLKN